MLTECGRQHFPVEKTNDLFVCFRRGLFQIKEKEANILSGLIKKKIHKC